MYRRKGWDYGVIGIDEVPAGQAPASVDADTDAERAAAIA